MKRYIVTLTPPERQELEDIIGRGTHAAAKMANALILLDCDTSHDVERRRSSEDIAQFLRISARKIENIKRRFVEEGFEVALGRKVSSRQYDYKIDGDVQAHLIALSCTQPPPGHSQWSLRLLADKAVELQYLEAASHETVRRALKKRTQTLAEGRLGDCPAGQPGICVSDGERTGRVQAPLRPDAASGLHG